MKKIELHEMVSELKKLASELGKTPTLKEFSKVFSRRQIDKFKYSEIVKSAGLTPNPHSATTPPVEVVLRPPRILFFDIETAPIKGYSWGIYEQNILKVLVDWFVLSFAGKFSDEDQYHYFDQRDKENVEDDYELIKKCHEMLSEADVLVSHNGDRFDIKKLNARFIKYDLPPLNHYKSVDTLKIARRFFSFTSNKLSDLANYLGCENKKSTHGKYPGFQLWDQCMQKNQEAFQEMEDYNKKDVDVLIDVYKKLAKWDSSINFCSYYQEQVCICGSKEFRKDGFKFNKSGKFQIYRCRVCDKTFIAKENLIQKEIRSEFFK